MYRGQLGANFMLNYLRVVFGSAIKVLCYAPNPTICFQNQRLVPVTFKTIKDLEYHEHKQLIKWFPFMSDFQRTINLPIKVMNAVSDSHWSLIICPRVDMVE